MTEGEKRLFAGRGIGQRGLLVTAGVVVGAFAVGMGVGWGTGLVAERLASPEPSVSASPSQSGTPEPDVTVPALEPIVRDFDKYDTAAGLTSLVVPERGEGTFTIASTDQQPTGTGAAVKWVRVEYEDGLALDPATLNAYVMATLGDYRGWGAHGTYEFVATTGAPDLRVVIASPYTAAARCPAPHTAATIGAVEDAAPDPSSSTAISCADEGLAVVSLQDWAAGLSTYGDNRQGARRYLVNHGVGHLLGESDVPCVDGRAEVMTNQVTLENGCRPNPWPWPDEPQPEANAQPSVARDQE